MYEFDQFLPLTLILQKEKPQNRFYPNPERPYDDLPAGAQSKDSLKPAPTKSDRPWPVLFAMIVVCLAESALEAAGMVYFVLGVAVNHHPTDVTLPLLVCDFIVPVILYTAFSFGHWPSWRDFLVPRQGLLTLFAVVLLGSYLYLVIDLSVNFNVSALEAMSPLFLSVAWYVPERY